MTHAAASPFPLPPLEAHAAFVEQHRLGSLLYCSDAWALRHRFVNPETGETIRARCNRWDCLYCGPRKVDQWRQLVKAAEPTLFLTLTQAGHTVEACARALTTFLQYVRRGSKGRGPQHVGAREAYPVEYFAVLERHSNFEQVGFHWHLLLRGVDFIPHEILKEGWRSATHGVSYIVHIEAIQKPQVIGYVTKYLMKSLAHSERGARVKQQQRWVYLRDEQGKVTRKKQARLVEVVSSARRIRYSRQFFPESVADLRLRLFDGLGETVMEQQGGEASSLSADDAEQKQYGPRSSWKLFEQEQASDDLEEHLRWRREALLEALTDLRTGQRDLSRRVISMWAYQRAQLRER